jgi:exonuclease-1
MGIKGLLIFLKDYYIKTQLDELKNKKIGIDGYVWIHKGIYSNNYDIADNKLSLSYVYYFIKNIKKLLKYNIIPIVVFDGRKLGIKNKEEDKREYKRNEMIKKANKYKEENNYLLYKKTKIKSIDITHNMVKKIIYFLNIYNIEYIIAPHESDAQLSYLDKIGYIDYIITEDSDLIAYGCKNILYKFDTNNDNFLQIKFKNIIKKFNNDYNIFLEFCILSGCDYFKLKGISIKTSYKYYQKNKYFISENNIINKNFYYAKYTFLHQAVYDPINKIYKYTNNILNNYNISYKEKYYFNIIEESPLLKCYIAGILDKPY